MAENVQTVEPLPWQSCCLEAFEQILEVSNLLPDDCDPLNSEWLNAIQEQLFIITYNAKSVPPESPLAKEIKNTGQAVIELMKALVTEVYKTLPNYGPIV